LTYERICEYPHIFYNFNYYLSTGFPSFCTSPLKESSTFVPLSFEGEGEEIYRRGASAPLKHPAKLVSFKGREMKKRGAKPPS
jgi:hypothetical protein